MSTETELVLMTMPAEELEDAGRWLNLLLDAWEGERYKPSFTTDGPWHALKALELAILRETAVRHGADPWYVGNPIEGHPAAKLLRYYLARSALNPERRHSPRTDAQGVIVQRCLHCRAEKPLTADEWERGERLWSLVCRACVRIDPERFRDLMLEDDERQTVENERRRATIAELMTGELVEAGT